MPHNSGHTVGQALTQGAAGEPTLYDFANLPALPSVPDAYYSTFSWESVAAPDDPPPSAWPDPDPWETVDQYAARIRMLASTNQIPSGYDATMGGRIFAKYGQMQQSKAGAVQQQHALRANLQANAPPLPHRINPIVWDSLGSVGQQLALGAAEQLGWDDEEFLAQHRASRPQGVAPRQVRTQSAPLQPFF